MPHGSDALDFVPDSAANASITLGQLEKAKSSSEHIEEVDQEQPSFEYNEDEQPEQSRTGLRKLLRRNPSYQFMKEVAEANQTELDPAEVKTVEKKLFWLIVPALFVDYIFYYVDKTTLSYAALFGIREDLNLTGADYSNLSSIFYIGWLVWAIPGNLLLR
jgi:hypothetical protein